MKKFNNREYLRSILFGIEDSLVSTTGLIAGISIGTENKQFVLLAGVVAIAIEAVSMGASEYLSDDTMSQLDKIKRHHENPFVSGLFMLFSYALAGLIPLTPVIYFNYPESLYVSILLALTSLFILGFIKGKLLEVSPIRGGIKFLFVGGLATFLGLIVGQLFGV